MNKKEKVFEYLQQLGIHYERHGHPVAPTVEIVKLYFDNIPNVQCCKNLFFRHYKGDKHYLVILDWNHQLAIRDLEQQLQQGRLSFVSEEQTMKYLDLSPASVSPFGLISDTENHIQVFLDEKLKEAPKLSFHPNNNTISLIIKNKDFRLFLTECRNCYEY